MTILDETRFVERLRFFNGQRLFAADLQGIEAFNREMRWLHNRSLHQPGIGSGFAVRGSKGDRQVWIGPGYALDAQGREIVLTQPLTLQVPPVASDDDGKPAAYDLAVRYPDDEHLEEAETRTGICDTYGVIRLREAPIFCWVRLERGERGQLIVQNPNLKQAILQGMLITLARVEVFNCQLHDFVSIAERRDARPNCLPYIACGVVDPTDWEIEFCGETRFILTADIDTKEAGFLTTPCYSAAILGERAFSIGYVAGRSAQGLLLVDHVYVQDPRRDGFTAFVVVDVDFFDGRVEIDALPTTVSPDDRDEAIEWFRDIWQLQWMGVEG